MEDGGSPLPYLRHEDTSGDLSLSLPLALSLSASVAQFRKSLRNNERAQLEREESIYLVGARLDAPHQVDQRRDYPAESAKNKHFLQTTTQRQRESQSLSLAIYRGALRLLYYSCAPFLLSLSFLSLSLFSPPIFRAHSFNDQLGSARG